MKKNALTFISLFIIILAINFLNIFPVIYAKIQTPKNMVFSGQASWFDPWDINLYVSAIHSGQINGFLLPNNYTTVPNQPILMYPLYTILGIIFQNLNPFLIFQTFAVIFGSVLIIVIYLLLKDFLNSRKERFIALLGICLGGGLGFLFYPNFQSADFTMTSFTFLSAFQRPHEALGITLYLLSLFLFYKNFSHQENISDLKKSSVSLIIFLTSLIFYPYYALSFLLINALFLFILNKGELKLSLYKNLFYLFIPAALLIFFINKHTSINPTFNDVFTQNLPTPNPLLLLSGYGILILFFIYELFFLKKNRPLLFLNIWFIMNFLLAFLPLGFSRFYLRGLFFPLVVIVIFTLKEIAKKYHLNYFLILCLLLFILILSNLKITYERMAEVNNKNPWYYMTKSEYQGIEFLKNEQKGVLSLYQLGNIIPALTNNTVYFGHLIQTPDSSQKLRYLYLFYSCQMPKEKVLEFIKQNNISFVLWGKEEKEVNKNYSKKGVSLKTCYQFLNPVFTNSDLTVYSVKINP